MEWHRKLVSVSELRKNIVTLFYITEKYSLNYNNVHLKYKLSTQACTQLAAAQRQQ